MLNPFKRDERGGKPGEPVTIDRFHVGDEVTVYPRIKGNIAHEDDGGKEVTVFVPEWGKAKSYPRLQVRKVEEAVEQDDVTLELIPETPKEEPVMNVAARVSTVTEENINRGRGARLLLAVNDFCEQQHMGIEAAIEWFEDGGLKKLDDQVSILTDRLDQKEQELAEEKAKCAAEVERLSDRLKRSETRCDELRGRLDTIAKLAKE